MNPRPSHTNFKRANVAVLLSIAALGVGLMYIEGYFPLLRWPFVLYMTTIALVACWSGAYELSAIRLHLMTILAAISGLITQYVGSDVLGVWTYQGPYQTYFFVMAMFAFAAVIAYGVAVLWLGPKIRGKIRHLPRWCNLLVIGILFTVLVAGSIRFDAHQSHAFWAYYLTLALFGAYASMRMDLVSLLSLVGSAILVGTLSETLGAMSGIWRFADSGTIPPAYLVLGSWPLEILFHYGASGLMAGERLGARPRWFKEEQLYQEHPSHPMFTGQKPLTVASVRHDNKFVALDEVLEITRFFDAIERQRVALGKERDTLRIAIKANLMFMYSAEDRTTFTDPALVEHLIDRLIERGYRDITVVESQSAYGNYFLDRDVPNVAHVAGYRPEGRYRIVDLTAEKTPHKFPGLLGNHVVGPTWRDADFRISFAKNKTHTWAFYTLTLKNIYGTLAEQDKIREYHQKREIYYPTIEMLLEFPVHFGLIDAHVSADGPFGIFADQRPNETKTVIGGENLLAVDWVGAQKMGLDPMISRYMQLAVQAFGRPHVKLIGDASVYKRWINVPKPLADFWDTAEESYAFTNTAFGILNRNGMSPVFRRRPFTGFVLFLSRIFSPLGTLVYKPPSKSNPPGSPASSPHHLPLGGNP